MATDAVTTAALRVREQFKRAKEGGYALTGWYFYIDRLDVARMVEHVLGPEPEEVILLPAPVAFGTFDGFGGTLDVAENVYTTGVGQKIGSVHPPEQCAGRPCVIHDPSDHHMRAWPTNFRTGGMFDIKPAHMERICPHGVGHPDPDDAAFQASIGSDVGVHGCDGCCSPGGYEALQGGS